MEQRKAPLDGRNLIGTLHFAVLAGLVLRKEPQAYRRLPEHGAKEHHAGHLDFHIIRRPGGGSRPHLLRRLAKPGAQLDEPEKILADTHRAELAIHTDNVAAGLLNRYATRTAPDNSTNNQATLHVVDGPACARLRTKNI